MKTVHWMTVVTSFLVLAGCGGDSGLAHSGTGTSTTGSVSFGLSDAPVDNLQSVTIEVDRITLKKEGQPDVVIDSFTFTSGDLDVVDADSFQINLLDYQGGEQAKIVNQLELKAGDYTDLRLRIIDQDANHSYVIDQDGNQVALNLSSYELSLGAFTVEAGGEQTFTIDFDLRQALTEVSGEYTLKDNGARLLDNASVATLQGRVDSTLFNTESPCDSKVDPTAGNVLYLYSKHGLVVENLADIYDSATSATAIPSDAIAPYLARAPLQQDGGDWTYQFGFLPAGDYTLAFSCDAAGDDPDDYDGTAIPLPSDQLFELSLSPGTITVCNLPIASGACGS